MNEHKISLNSPWFEFVQNGQKLWEGRRYKAEKYKVGDKLIIRHHTDEKRDKFTKTIKSILIFETFQKGLEYFDKQEKMQQVLPEIDTVKAGVEIYKKFVSIETQTREGVCFIEIWGVSFGETKKWTVEPKLNLVSQICSL